MFTGKERDQESGLDYFGARYYGSSLGRFTIPDPIFFQKEMIADPQRWNLYAYVRNNPLALVDPKGEAIELLGNDEERKKSLRALQTAVGSKAGKYLYDNPVETTDENGNKTTHHYIGILSGGPSGQGPDFASLNKPASRLAGIIGDQQTVGIHTVSKTTSVPVIGSLYDYGNAMGATLGYEHASMITVYVQDPSESYTTFPPSYMDPQVPGHVNAANNQFHELGHASYDMDDYAHRIGQYTAGMSGQRALDFENDVRRLKDPNAPIRVQHRPPCL